MSIRKRIENLEAKHQKPGVYYLAHVYQIREGQEPGHTRENCLTCAAMTDDEYKSYLEWLTDQPHDGPITALVIHLPEKRPVE